MSLNKHKIALVCSLGLGCSAGQDAVQVEVNMSNTTSPNSKVPITPESSSSAPNGMADGSGASAPKACSTDAECLPGFCDRDICAMLGRGNYGRANCTPEPPVAPTPPLPPGMLPGPPSASQYCGAYHCIEGRCRSCRTDDECTKGSICKPVEGFPGLRCGKVWPPEPKVPKSPPTPPDPNNPYKDGRQILQDPSQFLAPSPSASSHPAP